MSEENENKDMLKAIISLILLILFLSPIFLQLALK